MKHTFRTVALVGKITDPEIREPLLALERLLMECGIAVLVEEKTVQHLGLAGCTAVPLDAIGTRADLVVVLGGDGTMLMVARALVEHGVPLVGINRGRFGFLTDLTIESMRQIMTGMLAGAYTEEPRLLLGASIVRDGRVQSQGRALNDVVVSKGAAARMIELTLAIDGEFVHRQRSDGLILATPTGTTAYALSAGGPLLHPRLDALALVPICPHTLSNRPFAISSASRVEITLTQGSGARVHFDGQWHAELTCGDQVRVERLQQTITLLHPPGHSHYAMLREKLNWG